MPQIFQIPLRIKIAFMGYTLFFGTIGLLLLALALTIGHGMTLLLALIICTLGWLPFCRVIFKGIIKRQMLQSGEIVNTTFLKVQRVTKGPFLGWQGVIVITQWHDPTTNFLYHFKSGIISQDLSALMKLEGNQAIPVYVDRIHPKSRYYMDLTQQPLMTQMINIKNREE